MEFVIVLILTEQQIDVISCMEIVEEPASKATFLFRNSDEVVGKTENYCRDYRDSCRDVLVWHVI